MSLIPAIHSWTLANYARRVSENSTGKNEFFWSCLDANQTTLKMTITPALQLMIVSSEQCIEELLDIWLMFNCLHVHVHDKSVLFNYTWPPVSSSTNLTRSFRIKFSNNTDLNQCLKILSDYFPIHIYAPDDCTTQIDSRQPTMFHSLFFNETKDTLALEQSSTTMHIRPDFIRQYLSNCLMDPTFFLFVHKNEQMLKRVLMEK